MPLCVATCPYLLANTTNWVLYLPILCRPVCRVICIDPVPHSDSQGSDAGPTSQGRTGNPGQQLHQALAPNPSAWVGDPLACVVESSGERPPQPAYPWAWPRNRPGTRWWQPANQQTADEQCMCGSENKPAQAAPAPLSHGTTNRRSRDCTPRNTDAGVAEQYAHAHTLRHTNTSDGGATPGMQGFCSRGRARHSCCKEGAVGTKEGCSRCPLPGESWQARAGRHVHPGIDRSRCAAGGTSSACASRPTAHTTGNPQSPAASPPDSSHCTCSACFGGLEAPRPQPAHLADSASPLPPPLLLLLLPAPEAPARALVLA